VHLRELVEVARGDDGGVGIRSEDGCDEALWMVSEKNM